MEFIHDDKLNDLMTQGPATLRRASHVEPGAVLTTQHPDNPRYADLQPLQWYADLAPVDGPMLGPYPSRQQALVKEIEWLNSYHLGSTAPRRKLTAREA